MPPFIWGQVTSLLDARSIAVLGCTSPLVKNLLSSPHTVSKLHINLSFSSKIALNEWPQHWFQKYPTLVSIGLSLNSNSKLGPFTYGEYRPFLPSMRLESPLDHLNH